MKGNKMFKFRALHQIETGSYMMRTKREAKLVGMAALVAVVCAAVGPTVQAAVIVNAFTGEFEEVGALGRAVRYLPEEEARDIATKSLRLKMEQRREVRARLMFQPSDISHIRLYPFWEINVEDRVLYVDQLGKVYGAIKRSVPGD